MGLWQFDYNVWFYVAAAAISLILILTLTWHDFFYTTYGLQKIDGLIILGKTYGVGFYLHTAYTYLLVVTGALLLLHSVYQMPSQFRRQMLPIVLVIVVILLSNILYVTRMNPFRPYDATPISFVLVGIVFNFLSTRYGFLDIVPIAYNQVFRNIRSGIIIVDQRLHILALNPYAEKILSYPSDIVLGKPLSSVFPGCADLLIRNEDGDLKTELQFGKDSRTYSLSISSFKDGKGKSLGKIIMLYDITDLKNALDDLDTYAHTVAHDLKSPLGSLIGFSELLESNDLPDDARRDSLNIIKSSSTKMVQIVNGLLMLASARRQQDIQFEKLDMKLIVKNSLSRLEKLTAEKNGRVCCPDEWPSALGCEPWIEEVWINYISNALKYGGTSPVLYLGAERENGCVKFWVKDNGPGLSEEGQKQLFKEFNRLAYKGNVSGHGLGLSIVKRVMIKLNGDAGVESTLGNGAKFYFTLPAAD